MYIHVYTGIFMNVYIPCTYMFINIPKCMYMFIMIHFEKCLNMSVRRI